MTSHIGVMILFAACVSVVFAALLRDYTRDQIRFARLIFGVLVVGAYAAGWLMYLVF